MNTSSVLVNFGASFLAHVAAFIWSLQVNRRYAHWGFRLLSIGLGLEILATGFLLLFFALAAGGVPDSFILWSGEVLRYATLALLMGGWALLASTKRPIQARTPGGQKAAPVALSRIGTIKWGAIALLVISLLAGAWALLSIFANGMETAPRFTAGDAWAGALPPLILLPISAALAALVIRSKAGPWPLTFTVVSAVTNLLAALLVRVAFVTQ